MAVGILGFVGGDEREVQRCGSLQEQAKPSAWRLSPVVRLNVEAGLQETGNHRQAAFFGGDMDGGIAAQRCGERRRAFVEQPSGSLQMAALDRVGKRAVASSIECLDVGTFLHQ